MEMKLAAFAMLFAPPAGLIYFFGQFIVRKMSKRMRDLQMEDIGFSKERHHRVMSPDVERETQAIPLEEAFLVSDDKDKRKRLLFELKKDHISNFKMITKGLDNDDRETSHYAAAAITSAKADYDNDIREFDSKYNKDVDDLNVVRDYADYVYSYIKSDVLDPMEIKKYSYLYLDLLTNVKRPDDILTAQDYTNIVSQAIVLNEFYVAERWAQLSHEKYSDESSYLNLLRVYYYTNRAEMFSKTLDEMRSSDIPLTSEGVALVRFFLKPATTD